MSLALYRTYRPGKFADVIGQDHVTEPLMRALANDRTHHAYLFSGPRGCGKTSSARILARSLNCAAGPTAEPCEVCDSCVALAPNGSGSLDVIELDAASNRGIDQARELRERAMYSPASSKYRIYIIDEAHQLTTEAVNALLKLVEEPPAHLKFVFATTEPEKLLGTIRSRTHHYPFRLVPSSVLQDHLARVCESEGIAADPAALALAAKAGAGSVRDSLSVLGQLVGGAGPAGITYEAAVKQLGFTSDNLLDAILDSLPAKDGVAIFKTIEEVVSAGHDPRRFATDLLERIRDLIILLANPTAAGDGLINQPADRLDVLQTQAKAIGLPGLSRAADLVSDGITALRGATSPRLHLELLAARLLVSTSDADPIEMAARLDAIERKIADGLPAAANAGSSAPAKPTPPPKLSKVAAEAAPVVTPAAAVAEVATVVESATSAEPEVSTPAVVEAVAAEAIEVDEAAAPSTVDLATLQQNWRTIAKLVEGIPGGSKFASSLLDNFGVTALKGSTVEITTPNEPLLNLLKTRSIDKLAEQAITQFSKAQLKVVAVLDVNFKPNQSTPAAPENMTPKPLSATMPAAVPTTDVAADTPDEAPVSENIAENIGADASTDSTAESNSNQMQVSTMPPSEEPEPDDPIATSATGLDALLDAFGGQVVDDSNN
jgi:DNA polymerase III subunit gamma/tau